MLSRQCRTQTRQPACCHADKAGAGRAVTDKRIKMLQGNGTSKGIIVHLPALAVTLVVTFLIAIFITFLKLA